MQFRPATILLRRRHTEACSYVDSFQYQVDLLWHMLQWQVVQWHMQQWHMLQWQVVQWHMQQWHMLQWHVCSCDTGVDKLSLEPHPDIETLQLIRCASIT